VKDQVYKKLKGKKRLRAGCRTPEDLKNQKEWQRNTFKPKICSVFINQGRGCKGLQRCHLLICILQPCGLVQWSLESYDPNCLGKLECKT